MNISNKVIKSPNCGYFIFGLDLRSNYKFTSRIPVKKKWPDLIPPTHLVKFYYNKHLQGNPPDQTGKLFYSRKYNIGSDESKDQFYHFSDYDVLMFSWGATYFLKDNRIDCSMKIPSNKNLMELHLLGPVLAFWLERMGVRTLHASAIVEDDRTIAFPSHSGNGKSTLAASFCKSDAALLTDDILPIIETDKKFWGRPGLPQINFWPDQKSYFVNEMMHEFEKVNPVLEKEQIPVDAINNGKFCQESRPLECIYIPTKSDSLQTTSQIDIIPISPAKAVIELARYSYIPPFICERLGWQAARLELFSRMVKLVPVRRLIYPSGFEHLERVMEAVRLDLKKLPSFRNVKK